MTEHVSGRRRVAVGLASMVVGAVALVGALPGAAGATGDGGDHDLPFDHPCPNEGWYFHWGPNNQHTIPGQHDQDDPALEDEWSSDDEFSVEISNVRLEGERMTFDFATSLPVRLVFAMGYPETDPGGTIEAYDPAVTEGTTSVADDRFIKHVVFCPGDETPPSTEPTTTTTEAPTTTTTEAPTTTSTLPPSTDEPPTSVEPTTPSTEEPPSSEAPPTTQPASDEGELPVTGSTTMPLVAGAAALVAVGVALVAGRRFLQNRAAS